MTSTRARAGLVYPWQRRIAQWSELRDALGALPHESLNDAAARVLRGPRARDSQSARVRAARILRYCDFGDAWTALERAHMELAQ